MNYEQRPIFIYTPNPPVQFTAATNALKSIFNPKTGNKKEGKEYRVIALFSRPLAHVEAEKEWVEQFISTVEQEGLNENDS